LKILDDRDLRLSRKRTSADNWSQFNQVFARAELSAPMARHSQ